MPLRISMEWLRDYLELPESATELADALTLSGTEVERVIGLGQGWDGVFVARIAEVAGVPGSDHLQVAQLEVGERRVQVVSGAPNIRAGDLVPWAEPGTKLPNGMKISERLFMKVQSQGMMCSPVELGISEEADGILILGTEGVTGVALSELIPPDQVMVIETTTNRPDLLCHLGIARELSALLRRPVREPEARVVESGEPGAVGVAISDPDLCARYQAREVAGVTVGPSPAWLQRRLRAVGQKPINNVVDAANYVMFETGQPLHAFDADRLSGGIVVRRATDGEELACLDGRTRKLDRRDLVVADGAGPVALAGLIGGAVSAVSATTTAVVIESANFLGTSIRGSSRRLALRTEASTRFEKQLSPELVGPAAARLAALVQETAGGGPSSMPAEAYPRPYDVAAVSVPVEFVSGLLGDEVPATEVVDDLRRLHFDVAEEAGGLRVTPPRERLDVRVPVDLVEEVGRLRGYNTLTGTLPGRRLPVGDVLPPPDPEWAARDLAMGAGYDEVINAPFSPAAELAIGVYPEARLRLVNPMTVDQSHLRSSLLPGLARTLARNAAWGNPGARVFELGRVFWPRPGEELPDEPRILALAVHVRLQGRSANAAAVRQALLDVKGALELIARRMSAATLVGAQGDVPGLHPGRGTRLSLDGGEVGALGELHPDLVAGLDVTGSLVLAEIEFDALVRRPRAVLFAPPSRFPAVPRDLAVTVPEQTPAAEAIATVEAAGGVILRSVDLYDEYRGSQVVPGRKGLTFRLTFQADDRTLTGDEVAEAEKRIAAAARERLGAEPRG